ncbi:MAG: right-handed parallel beta-helix repeat-containing protein, partial [Clostridia bacterium]|nr:right-handed parallel beta-helix repeat-containing protein [Clostridia bacterium]
MKFRITKILTGVILSLTLLFNAVPHCCAASGNVYYVDSISGNDENSGTDENSPWKSLDKVNETVFQPGDIIKLKAGCEWIGQFNPKGSGTEGAPITVTAYGEGEKPHIKGEGTTDTAFLLFNQQYWEIDGIQVSNNASAVGDFRGIGIKGTDAGVLKHFTIKNCYIHDVTGQVSYFGSNDSWYEDGKRTGGIIFWTDTVSGIPTWFEDVL